MPGGKCQHRLRIKTSPSFRIKEPELSAEGTGGGQHQPEVMVG